VQTASAAIKGQHPDTTGEVYGVVGTSASVDGAGVAAANLDGGPDLVLDGLTHGETDTALWEGGIDRASVNSEVFEIVNSGPGAIELSVAGTVAATDLDCPDCIGSDEIVDGSISGNDLADGAVTGAKIGSAAVDTAQLRGDAVTSAIIEDGTIEAADLAANAVTGAALADGSVGSSELRTNAVGTANLADGAVTSTKIGVGAVDTAQLRGSAVTSAKIEDGAIIDADLAFAAVGKNQLQDNAVVTGKILDGTITGADIDPASWVYVSKSQLYEREESVVAVVTATYEVSAECDDANDLPLSGSCELNPDSFMNVRSQFADNWDSLSAAAEWTCHFENTSGSGYAGIARILCISVP
jgi:hypothetical protein